MTGDITRLDPDKKDIRNKWIYRGLLALISMLFLATRLFRLDLIPFGPHGLHIDEIGAAYDSFCIANYGVDQYLYKFPVYFKCFGEGQNALYTYLAAVVFKLAGVSIFNFRLVAVICATLAFIAMYHLSKILLDRSYALVSVVLMTIMPVYMMSEHWGLEAYLFLSFAIISMCLTITAVREKATALYLFAGIGWGVTLYNYAITYMIIPPFVVLMIVYMIYIGERNIKRLVAFLLPVIFLGIPLFIQQLVMMEIIPPFEFFGIIDFWKPEYYRYSALSLSNIWANLKWSSIIVIRGDLISYNSNEWFGTIYYVSVPFMLIGLYKAAESFVRSLRKKESDLWGIIFMYYTVARVALLFVTEPNINRANGLYLPYLLFTALGIKTAVNKINKRAFAVAIACAYLISFTAFSYYFYSYNGYRKTTDLTDGDKVDTRAGESVQYAKSITKGKEIYAIMNDGWYIDYAIALFTETSPYDYTNDQNYDNDRFNGVVWGVPGNLDLSGNIVYVIDRELKHITDYLVGAGFKSDPAFDKYDIVYK